MIDWQRVMEYGIIGVSVLAAVASLVGAMRAGVLKRFRLGSIEIEATPQERERARELVRTVVPEAESVPFETEQLALYYGQILAQSKVSFWFSLVFASLGFVVLVAAVFMYSSDSQGTTVAQFVAGTIMDAVAALFFVQSRNAQTAMGEFFDKLRKDRHHLESRKLCESIENSKTKDALKVQLALHYAEVKNSSGIAETLIAPGLEPIERAYKPMQTDRPSAGR
jgi:hypothetical protein